MALLPLCGSCPGCRSGLPLAPLARTVLTARTYCHCHFETSCFYCDWRRRCARVSWSTVVAFHSLSHSSFKRANFVVNGPPSFLCPPLCLVVSRHVGAAPIRISSCLVLILASPISPLSLSRMPSVVVIFVSWCHLVTVGGRALCLACWLVLVSCVSLPRSTRAFPTRPYTQP